MPYFDPFDEYDPDPGWLGFVLCIIIFALVVVLLAYYNGNL